ncbi:hypothetical protein AVEN_103077-1 [Araneus ventricosus]|uniref:Uncharacterized protein n=1 Tax=Araneus ventricosus TaxID=182803 RepID=A0A4Y2BAI5_ARAVE|nr:hypothetical protein AVEN_103077-1 [Araneus ventricosus]
MNNRLNERGFPPNLNVLLGRGGNVVRFRLRGGGFQVLNLIPLNISQSMWTFCTLNHKMGSNVLPLVSYESLERRCQLRCRLHHLAVAQNDEILPKIALVLLTNRR